MLLFLVQRISITLDVSNLQENVPPARNVCNICPHLRNSMRLVPVESSSTPLVVVVVVVVVVAPVDNQS